MNIKDTLKAAQQIAEVAAAEGRALTTEENDRIEAAMGAAKSASSARDLAGAVDALAEELGAPTAPAAVTGSLGKRFVEDPAIKAWVSSVAANGLPDAKAILHSPAVNVAANIKALITGESSDSAGALLTADFRGLVDQVYGRRLTIADLITTGNTTSDQVEYARILSTINGAGPVAEATAHTGTGAMAFESTMTFERASAPVREIKHWLPVTSRAMSDAPELASLTDAFLRYGVAEEVEDQVLSGDGTGENMEGILSVSGTLAQGFDTDIVTTLRKAITQIKVSGRANPSAILLNPADNEMLDLLTLSAAGYAYPGVPAGAPQQTFFGLPRVESVAVPQGTAIIADWREAVLLSRAPVTVQMSNQHSDFFLRGLVAVLATARAAFFVRRPAAFCIAELS